MPPGQIILLNGASSAGKTSLIKALQDQLAEPYLDAGLDRFLWMLPKHYLDRPGWDEVLGLVDHAGPVGVPFISGLHHAIAALSLAGNNVLADHVLVEPAWVRECAQLFAGLPALFIALRCPLEILEQRESQRGDRTLGQARTQFPFVHAHNLYDLEIDTSLYTSAECAGQIIHHLRTGPPPPPSANWPNSHLDHQFFKIPFTPKREQLPRQLSLPPDTTQPSSPEHRSPTHRRTRRNPISSTQVAHVETSPVGRLALCETYRLYF